MASFATQLAVLSTLAATAFSAPAAIPQFALDYAPLVYLHSEDPWFPGPISAQLLHTHPTVNFTSIPNPPSPLTLSNLASLNALGGTEVALSSNDDFTLFPDWLRGAKPDAAGKTPGEPSSVIISAPKGGNVVDVFYMYWYPFNQGNKVFNQDAGNHVGDWEHNAIRFEGGVPTQVYFSQHSGGEAFTYGAVEKQGKRPVAYSAKGSHATYATQGDHDHTIPGLNLPFGIFLIDKTNKGPLWDPVLNAFQYSVDPATIVFTPHSATPDAPTSYLDYQGIWGDKTLPRSDKRQKYILGLDVGAMWTGGPTGPKDKNLQRKNVCPDGKDCLVKKVLLKREEELEGHEFEVYEG